MGRRHSESHSLAWVPDCACEDCQTNPRKLTKTLAEAGLNFWEAPRMGSSLLTTDPWNQRLHTRGGAVRPCQEPSCDPHQGTKALRGPAAHEPATCQALFCRWHHQPDSLPAVVGGRTARAELSCHCLATPCSAGRSCLPSALNLASPPSLTSARPFRGCVPLSEARPVGLASFPLLRLHLWQAQASCDAPVSLEPWFSLPEEDCFRHSACALTSS